jgi:type I restriction enzyme S subunit
MGKFTDLFKLGGGGTPATSIKEYWNGNVPLFSPEDVKDTFLVSKTVRNITEKGLNKCNSQLYPIYSSFLTVRGTVGKIGMNIVPMAMNQSCYAIICKLYNAPFFTYCSTKHCVEVLKKQAVGAVFNAMVTRDFEVIDYIIPSLNDIEIFENQVYKIFNHIHNLKLELDLTKNLLNLLTSKLSKN